MTAVCVAGMHRSGTSLFAGTLRLCGVYLGEETDIAPAAPENPQGYWENIHFLRLNERVLASLGGGWDLPPATVPGWENLPEIVACQVDARASIQKLARHPHWGWKDPRSSLTMPFWRQLIPDLKVVICLREPLEVARSLARRGAASEVFSLNLWLTYYQRLLADVPAPDRLVTHYEALLHDGRTELRRILGFLDIRVDARTLDEACRLINLDLRHHRAEFAQASGSALYPQVRRLYLSLCTESGPTLLAAKDLQLTNLANALKDIQESRAWKIGQLLRRVYRWFRPHQPADNDK